MRNILFVSLFLRDFSDFSQRVTRTMFSKLEGKAPKNYFPLVALSSMFTLIVRHSQL